MVRLIDRPQENRGSEDFGSKDSVLIQLSFPPLLLTALGTFLGEGI